MVICLERDADLHMAQLMPLPLTVACFSKIQIGFTFLVRLTRVVLEKGPLNVCVCVYQTVISHLHVQPNPITGCQQTMLNYHQQKSVTTVYQPSFSSLDEQIDADSSFLDAEFADFTLAADANVSPEKYTRTI